MNFKMLTFMLSLSLLAFTGCGSAQDRQPAAAGNRSVADHERSAQEHGEQARSDEITAERSAGGVQCYDQPLEDVNQSGGDPHELLRPCWTPLRSVESSKRDADRHRQQAEAHRKHAARLLDVERAECQNLGKEEIGTSPFWHREDIVNVYEFREKGSLRGARIVFRKVPGLSAVWFRQAARCHQARAAVMGYSANVMPYCPMALPEVTVEVTETDEHLDVIVRSRRAEVATQVLERGTALVSRAGGE